MISNPFSRKPKSPVDQALDAFDSVRADAADYAATIRDAASDIADTLAEIGPPAPKRRLPVIAAAVAAALGIGYLVRSRLSGGSAPGPVPEVPGPPAAAPTATATAARTTATPAVAESTPASPGDSEPPKEPKAETAESTAGNGKPENSTAEAGGEAADGESAEEEKG
jgi:hypothetical protein